MHYYIVHNDRKPSQEIFKAVLKCSLLLIRGLIKRLIPNKAIFDIFSIEIHYYAVHNDSKPLEYFLRQL